MSLSKDFQPSAVRDRQERQKKKREKKEIQDRQTLPLEATRTSPIHHEILNPSSFILLLLPPMVPVLYNGRFRPPLSSPGARSSGFGWRVCVSVSVSKAC